jgi:dipeptidyl aminopeptidase/acylaminoacyl peptidase
MIKRLHPVLMTLLAFGVCAATANAQHRDPVQPDDYGQWESLGRGILSPNGEWLAVQISRVNGENELRIHEVASDSVIVVAYGGKPVFSKDGLWVAYSIGKSQEEQERIEKNHGEVKDDLGLTSLRTGDQRLLTEIQSFSWGGGGSHLTMARYPNEDTRVVVVESMSTGARVSFANVDQWAWQEDGPLLAFTVEGADGVGNGVQLFHAGTGRITSLDSSESEYARLTWRDDASDLAVLRGVEDEDRDGSAQVLLAWRALDDALDNFELEPSEHEAIGDDERIVDFRPLTWSKDGQSIFFGVKEWKLLEDEARSDSESPSAKDASDGVPATAPVQESDVQSDATGAPSLDPPKMEIWRSTDERTLPTQKRDERADEQRNDLFVWQLDADQVLRLTDESLDRPRIVADGKLVLATNNDAYRLDGMFGRGRVDVHAIDPGTGEHQIAAEGVGREYGASPSGRFVHYYRGGQFYAFDRDTGNVLTISEGAGVSFANAAYDHPVSELPSFGVGGWTENDHALLAYDEFDVWELPVDGDPRRLTNGRTDEIVHRTTRLDPEVELNLDDGVYLTLHGKWSLNSGIGLVRRERVERLVYEDNNIGRLQKASDADVYAYVAQDFDDSPDYFVGRGFEAADQVTHTNPFQGDYAWGRTELVPYTNHNGVPLHGALFYPANYDASKKYPMIVYVYEFRSQSAKQYAVPSHRNYYNP